MNDTSIYIDSVVMASAGAPGLIGADAGAPARKHFLSRVPIVGKSGGGRKMPKLFKGKKKKIEGKKIKIPGMGEPAHRDLSRFFRHEVGRLRTAIGGKEPLYEHPWYLLVGESGSGKTSLVASSTLYDWSGGEANQFRGAQYCSWWASEEGMLLDVTGDYILRADGTADERGWRRLIGLLRRYRYRRAIDGVIVTVPASYFTGPEALDTHELARRGKAVGEKLHQLVRSAAMVLPVYLVVTKCDCVTGFRSFVGHLPEERRGDMFGWSNPNTIESEYSTHWIEDAFQSILGVVYPAQLEMLADVTADKEHDSDDLFLFPSELQGLHPGVHAYADQLFRAGAVDTGLLMRGLYFTGDYKEESAAIDISDPLMLIPVIPFVPTPELSNGGNGTNGKNGTNGTNGANGKNGTNGHAHHEANGKEKKEEDAKPAPRETVRFAKRLIFEKIFRESTLAIPATRMKIAAHRGVLATQIAIVLLIFAMIVGGAIEYPALHSSFDEAGELMEEVRKDLRNVEYDIVEPGQDTYEGYVEYAKDLFNGLIRLESLRMTSPLYPSSWFSHFHDSLDRAMGRAFTLIIMKAMHAKLNLKARQLRLYEFRLSHDTSGIGPFSIERTFEYGNLRKFADEMTELEQYIARYNGLARTQDLKDVARLVKYLFGVDLPKSFLDDAGHYRSALAIPDNLEFDLDAYHDQALHTTEVLLGRLERRIFDDNVVLVSAKKILGDIDYLQRAPGSGTELVDAMARLSGSIETLNAALADSGTAWLGGTEFYPSPALADLASDLDSSAFLRPASAARMFLSACGVRFDDIRHQLNTQVSDAVGGKLVDVDMIKSRLHAAPMLDTLRGAIDALLGQRFMQVRQRERVANRRTPGTRVFWNGDQLAMAMKLADGYNAFVVDGLGRFPQRLQGAASRAMRTGLDASIVATINPAQRSEGNDGGIDNTKREIRSMTTVSSQMAQLLESLDRMQLPSYPELSSVVRGQCEGMLRDLSRARDQFGIYTIDQARLRQWERDPDKPFALVVFDGDEATIGDKLAADQKFILELAEQSAEPLLSFLSTIGGARADAVDEWRKILTELRRYENKATGNSVASIEKFFLDLSSIDEENYRERLERLGTSNYFLRRREIARRMVDSVFSDIIAVKARRRYADLRESFNGSLVGRYPFADYRVREARSPGSVSLIEMRHFFSEFDLFVKRYETVWKRWGRDSATQSERSAYRFIDSMKKVRSFLTPLLDADPDKEPEFQVEVDLRVNQIKELGGKDIIGWSVEIGDQELTIQDYVRQGGLPWRAAWKVGDRIKVTLRWAGNSSIVPKEALLGSARVSDRSVEFTYNTSAWSLIHLLSTHKAPSSHLERNALPHILEFSVGTVPIAATADAVTHYSTPDLLEARVFLRLTVIGKNRRDLMTMPVFPTTEAE